MILTNDQILAAYKSGDIIIEPFDEEQLQGASYDLRVGEQGATTSEKHLVKIAEKGFIVLHPGDFAVVTVHEILRLGPQYVGRFGLRSKYARKGVVATTGPQIDPGYHGRLIVGLTNLTPRAISLPHRDDLLTVEFHKLDQPTTKPYSGPYQDRVELGAEEIEFITEQEGLALSEMLTMLRSLSENVGNLTSQMKMLQWMIPLIVTVGIAVISIVVSVIVSLHK
jgi:dCTP deaminase